MGSYNNSIVTLISYHTSNRKKKGRTTFFYNLRSTNSFLLLKNKTNNKKPNPKPVLDETISKRKNENQKFYFFENISFYIHVSGWKANSKMTTNWSLLSCPLEVIVR